MQIFINTFGTYVHVKDQMFEIRLKTTSDQTSTPNTPKILSPKRVTSFIFGPGTALSSDAIQLALSNNIDILFCEYDGTPLGRVWHSKLGSTTKIRKCQLVASLGEQAVFWVTQWIGQKLQNQIDFLAELKKYRDTKAEYIGEKILQISKYAETIKVLEAKSIKQVDGLIRGLEGNAGRVYFETLSSLLATEYQFTGRSSRPAQDPFNTFLNYAYGIMYGRVEKALIISGIDPYLGFMHRDDYNQKSMVYDFIEPYRIYAETAVFRLFSAKKINQSHTDKILKGYSLNTEGKKLLGEAFTKYFEEDKIRYKNRNVCRETILQSEAHSFAQSLLGIEFDGVLEQDDLLGDV